jgi:hypothetical protein
MANVFGTSNRGCFEVIAIDASDAHGITLSTPGGGTIPSGPQEPVITLGFSFTEREVVTFNKTFGGKIYTYAFGHDPNASNISVNMLGFLAAENGSALSTMADGYRKSRISQNSNLAILNFRVGSAALKGYIVGLSSNTTDSLHSLQQFTWHLAMVEPQ